MMLNKSIEWIQYRVKQAELQVELSPTSRNYSVLQSVLAGLRSNLLEREKLYNNLTEFEIRKIDEELKIMKSKYFMDGCSSNLI